MNPVIKAISLVWFMFASAVVWAADAPKLAERFVEGEHYAALRAPVPTRDAKRIEVVEVFSYGCPHCYTFDSAISSWAHNAAPDIDFSRVPAVWNPQFRVLGQAFYAAQSLKLVDKSHTALFKALHEDGKPLVTAPALAEFYEQFGVAKAQFIEVMNSFGVRSSVQQADSNVMSYGVSGVPSMIVNGKYRVDGRMAGTNETMLEVVNFLIDKERAAKAGTASR